MTSPHALCYPAIVGATQPIVIHNGYADNAEVEKNDFVDVIDEEKKKRADQVCFELIPDTVLLIVNHDYEID